MRGGRVGSLAASPTLVGAVTVLVVVVAVFLSYQANKGLPFVPTYQISAEVPNANTLVPGNDVRIGGIRVGQITDIQPVSHEDGSVGATVDMELNQDLEPLPEDTNVVVRSRSALGLKYLELRRGTSDQGFPAGSTLSFMLSISCSTRVTPPRRVHLSRATISPQRLSGWDDCSRNFCPRLKPSGCSR